MSSWKRAALRRLICSSCGDEHLAPLVAALLHARLLILDVVAGDAHLDEAANEVADVRVAAVPGVGVGDDEGAEVDLGRRLPLLLGHPRARVELVLVRREQRADDRRRLVGDLAERVAGEVRARVLLLGALRARRPAAEVDPLDAGPLHRDGLARRVGAERSDALPLLEELAQPRVEGVGRGPRDRVVVADAAPLLGYLARRVNPAESPGSGGSRTTHEFRRPHVRTYPLFTLCRAGEIGVFRQTAAVASKRLKVGIDARPGNPQIVVVDVHVQEVDVPGALHLALDIARTISRAIGSVVSLESSWTSLFFAACGAWRTPRRAGARRARA